MDTTEEEREALTRDMIDAIVMLDWIGRELRDRGSVLSRADCVSYRVELGGIIRICESYQSFVRTLLRESNEHIEELQAKDALIEDLLEQINLKVQAEGAATAVDESVQIMARMKSGKDLPPLEHN